MPHDGQVQRGPGLPSAGAPRPRAGPWTWVQGAAAALALAAAVLFLEDSLRHALRPYECFVERKVLYGWICTVYSENVNLLPLGDATQTGSLSPRDYERLNREGRGTVSGWHQTQEEALTKFQPIIKKIENEISEFESDIERWRTKPKPYKDIESAKARYLQLQRAVNEAQNRSWRIDR